ncbi:hypothetical protein [Accumulibacter sp.]|jgi:CubicO group peptidase (beta-lactamase class C family)|uniref:hypothetical protein n=1 Tax=Accumulibacter sp. TaxID=2053492 RepID=UPI002C74D736|nr:hypothetical protein [Accumulibacter sp.]HPU81213.1 serine hydrolase [Accumulibacter sp.]
MKYWLALLPLLLPLTWPLSALAQCTVEPLARSSRSLAHWIDQDNWLAPENLRFGLQSAGSFMPLVKLAGRAAAPLPAPLPRQIDLDKIRSIDPLDQQKRTVGFLLESRLYADGLLVLRDGKVFSERYWNGLAAQQPRLLLGATRPLLSLLGAIAVAQGKLAPDRSVLRYIPALGAQTGLRKLSMRRLIAGESSFEWSPQELADWQAAGGWTSGGQTGGIRGWLSQSGRWDRNSAAEPLFGVAGPEGELLAWALAESYRLPLARIFCDELFGRLRSENAALWLTDAQGTELSTGLALSLRDFARLGQLLIEARNSSGRSRIPKWFIETLTASAGLRTAEATELAGLKKGSEFRYGFVHLGGTANRIAILGPYGNSLYVDLDRRLVIAIFAAYPRNQSAGMRATLEQVWDTLGAATQPGGRR